VGIVAVATGVEFVVDVVDVMAVAATALRPAGNFKGVPIFTLFGSSIPLRLIRLAIGIP
jgi:hypothetical protein